MNKHTADYFSGVVESEQLRLKAELAALNANVALVPEKFLSEITPTSDRIAAEVLREKGKGEYAGEAVTEFCVAHFHDLDFDKMSADGLTQVLVRTLAALRNENIVSEDFYAFFSSKKQTSANVRGFCKDKKNRNQLATLYAVAIHMFYFRDDIKKRVTKFAA